MAELGLRAPRHAVDGRAAWWWGAQIAGAVAPVVAVLAALAVVLPEARPWLAWPAAALAALGAGGAVLVGVVRRRVHRWELVEPTALLSRTGLLWQEHRAVPLSRVQGVDCVRGPLQTAFGLATVTVTTASARGPVRIAGLGRGVAEELAGRLTEATGATRGDAT